MKKADTIAVLALAAAAMALAGASAPRTGATPSVCHSTALSLKAPARATAGSTVTVSGREAKTPAHTVKATLQSRLSTSKKWVSGASMNLSSGAYSLAWKVPAKKGTYKLRVRVLHGSTSNTSPVRTVTVK